MQPLLGQNMRSAVRSLNHRQLSELLIHIFQIFVEVHSELLLGLLGRLIEQN